MNTFNRRQFLNKAGMGFGALSMAGMMNNPLLAAENKANPLAPKLTDHPARAKRVIFGVSP